MTMSTKTNRTSKSGQATNRNVATATSFVRDAKGRFASTSTTVRPSTKAKNALKSAKTASSSFIQSMTVNKDNTVSVVMYRNPKTTYNYKPTVKGLSKINTAIKNGGSLGSVYNTELKGREISRLIIK
jgi:hypothetical protein